VKLHVIGSSPAWPNPGGAQSGYLVEGEGRLLLDCGPGVLARLRERESWPALDAIAITHFHLDHWGDLVPWVWGTAFGLGRDTSAPELWLPPGGAAHLRRLGDDLGRQDMFDRAFSVREYSGGQRFTAAGFDVTPTRVLHYDLETYGFRVTDGKTVLAYSGDSGPCPQLAELAAGADLFLCEATLQDAASEGDPRGHLTVEEATGAFRESGATRLLLTHRPQELGLDGSVEQASDGLELEV